MFSKEESRKLREEFWVSFNKSFPRRWILYRTKVKGLSLKFTFDVRKAIVSLDIDTNLEKRIEIWERLTSLQTILHETYLPNAIFEEMYYLEHKKEISRIYVQLDEVSIHNKNSWRNTMEFLHKNMMLLEEFFIEYEDILRA